MQNVYFDIESIPCQDPAYRDKVRATIKPPGTIKKPESIAAWLAENADTATDEAVAKTSFDPAHGHICCLAVAFDDGPVMYWEARKVADERHILEAFFAELIQPTMGQARFIGHNITGFDLRFILCRAIVLGVPIPKVIPRDIKPWSNDIFDTMTAWAGARGTIGQVRLAGALDIDIVDDIDGSMVAAAWANGDYANIARHCMSDVETVRAIHRRFVAVGF